MVGRFRIICFLHPKQIRVAGDRIICIGAALTDEIYTSVSKPVMGTSNPAVYRKSAGGVARNVAANLAQLGMKIGLVTHFGTDSEGGFLLNEYERVGIDCRFSKQSKNPTGRFSAILNPDGELFAAATVSYLEEEIIPEYLDSIRDFLRTASLLLADCNLPVSSLDWLMSFSRECQIPLILEPVSIPKIKRLAGLDLKGLFLLTPNFAELEELTEFENMDSERIQLWLQNAGIQSVWIRMGSSGSKLISEKTMISAAAPVVSLVDSTGAGDAALAGWIFGCMKGKDSLTCIQFGHSLAALILEQNGSTFAGLNPTILEQKYQQLYAPFVPTHSS